MLCPGCNLEAPLRRPAENAEWVQIQTQCSACKTNFIAVNDMQDNGDEEAGIMDVPEAEMLKFFQENPNPTDHTFHEHSEEKGWNNHQAEAVAYRFATRFVAFATGGRSKGKRPEDMITSEESMGQQVELEHTPDMRDALKIVWDHLSEVPNSKYYSFLNTIEKVLKAGPDHELYKQLEKLTEKAEELR